MMIFWMPLPSGKMNLLPHSPNCQLSVATNIYFQKFFNALLAVILYYVLILCIFIYYYVPFYTNKKSQICFSYLIGLENKYRSLIISLRSEAIECKELKANYSLTFTL